MAERFWMVYVEGTSETRRRYEVRAIARTEAERLVRETGRATYLLEAVEVCAFVVNPVAWKDTEVKQ